MSHKEKTEKKPKEKLNYGTWRNAAYIIRSSFRAGEGTTLFITLALALCSVASNLLSLYLSPAILDAVERHVSLGEFLAILLVFTGGVLLTTALYAYLDSGYPYKRNTIRDYFNLQINRKALRTAYIHHETDSYKKKLEAAYNATFTAKIIWPTILTLIANTLKLIVYAGIITTVHPLLLVVIFLCALLNYYIGKKRNLYRQKHRDIEEDAGSKLWHIEEVSIEREYGADIRIFGMRPWLEELWEKSFSVLLDFERKVENANLLARIADIVLSFLRNGIAYAVLLAMVLDGKMNVSEFLLVFSAVGGFSGWFTGILGNVLELHRFAVRMVPYYEIVDMPEPFRFEDGDPLPVRPDGQYELRLEDVSFTYPTAEKPTLSHISFTLRPGEKIAIVGLNGAGKTTLVRILCGLFDPTEGRVLLNGEDIRRYNRQDYYRMFSAVFQDFSLLPATVAVNIAQSEDKIDYERVHACLAQAGLTEKLASLPGGVETKLNHDIFEDGIQLSGGETQRLMLARALYKDAPIILLDEPTAALDPIAEADMYEKYHSMTGGRSSIYISHRLASTRFCDRILLLDGASIAEEGTHEALLQLGGKYAELFEVQSRYYKEDHCDD